MAVSQRPTESGADAPTGRRRGPVAPDWPDAGGRRIIFLLDSNSRLERHLLERWIAETRPPGVAEDDYELFAIPPSRRRRWGPIDPDLDAALATHDDPLLQPLRIAWRAPQRGGDRAVRPRDLLTFGDPRDPGVLRQRWVLFRDPDRCVIVAATPAPVGEVRTRWAAACGADSGATTGLAEFVSRQAALALERAERRLRGARYKVPTLVEEEILGRPAFRGELALLARSLDLKPRAALRSATKNLREIAATHSAYTIDLVAHLIRLMYTQGYGENLQYDREQLNGIFRLAQRHPVVFLPTHKSNLDHLVLQYALHENGLPPNHTAGGINMNFFPVGQLVRRSGVFFIRRSFKDQPIYKHVLRSYIDYLVEKRFSLEWYIEGGRSRSGKLLPPRFGLLAYVVDAYRRAKSEDVFLIPVSIAYDQIQDVGSYAAEQRGAAKQKESFSWFVGVIRNMRARYGDIHIRFGEPLSVRQAIGPPDPEAEPDPDEQDIELQKIAFEVSARINRVTPITPTSLVTLALLGTGDLALTVEETRLAMANILDYVRRRKLPSTFALDELDSDEGVRAALDALVENQVITRFDIGPENVYAIGSDQQLAAAYYRNTVVHFFVNASIAELALLAASRPTTEDPVATFWQEAMDLRDLLKFEFFFSEKEEFRNEIREELAFQDPDWEARLSLGPDGARALIMAFRPYSAHRVLRPFLEAYQVVGDCLRRWPADEPLDQDRFIEHCLDLGRQYHLRKRIHSTSSISKVLFQTGLRLAGNRGLLEADGARLAESREAFHKQLRAAIRRVDVVDALAATRRAGWLR
ncbi:MAG: glycerol-3-phosphate 1-O-acyltransferase [Myxococcota bacterium]